MCASLYVRTTNELVLLQHRLNQQSAVMSLVENAVYTATMEATHSCYCTLGASHKGARRAFKPPLQLIPVGGLFHQVAVNILKLPLTSDANHYIHVAVFTDYLTKLPKAFAIPDQKADTIAPLFLEHIVCCHGIPEALLTDEGRNFLSSSIQEIYQILGVKKINMSGYHLQTDRLVEKLNTA